MKEKCTSNITIPLSAFGPLQYRDMERSSGLKWSSMYMRACTVLKGPNLYASNGDRSPYRMADMFGGDPVHYNHHAIFQVSTCPYKCPYCYVDRLEKDVQLTAKEIVIEFSRMKTKVKELMREDINVLHMMGGDPAVYCNMWPSLRYELDMAGYKDVILYSDCLMIEEKLYGVKPWEFIDFDRFILVCCLKGTNWINFKDGTGGFDLYGATLVESFNYSTKPNVYFTFINYDKDDFKRLGDIFPPEKVDLLTVVHYEVTRQRLEGYLD